MVRPIGMRSQKGSWRDAIAGDGSRATACSRVGAPPDPHCGRRLARAPSRIVGRERPGRHDICAGKELIEKTAPSMEASGSCEYSHERSIADDAVPPHRLPRGAPKSQKMEWKERAPGVWAGSPRPEGTAAMATPPPSRSLGRWARRWPGSRHGRRARSRGIGRAAGGAALDRLGRPPATRAAVGPRVIREARPAPWNPGP